MRTCVGLTTIVLALACTAGYAEEKTTARFNVGYRLLRTHGPAETELLVSLWYPTRDEPGRFSYPATDLVRLVSDVRPDAAPADGPFPLVVYSHGAGGCGTMGSSYAEALAAAGFVVAAPDHSDGFQVARSDGSVDVTADRVREWQDWAVTRSGARFRGQRSGPTFKFAHRPPEVRATIDFVLALNADTEGDLHGLVDRERIGMTGVSFGAWTTSAVAGFHRIYRDERIKAAAPIAGPTNPSLGSYANVHVPLLIIFGQNETVALRDRSSGTKTEGMRAYHKQANAPKYLVGIADAEHLHFGSTGRTRPSGREELEAATLRRNDPVVSTVNRYLVAFFRRHLAGDESTDAVLEKPSDHTFVHEAETDPAR